MNKASLSSHLKTKQLGGNLFFYSCTDSTNAKAKSMANERSLKEGTIIAAAQQTQGKGTDGNHWYSAEGNLYLSVVFPFDEKVTTLFPLYPAVALTKVLRQEYDINAHVKWPNDILVGSKKIAGILCEGASGRYMIMGMGINILQNKFQVEIENKATSIALEYEGNIKIEEVFQSFLKEYEALYYGHCDIRQEWLNHTQMIGKTIKTTQDGIEKSVLVSGLSPEGYLEVTNDKGKSETWMARRGLDINAKY